MDNPFARKKKHGPRVHLPKRRKKTSRWNSTDSSDCCCIVGEVFDGPCFVATAAHDGNRAAEPVRTLRRYRDQRLAGNPAGRLFTRVYYRYGRYGARFLHRFPAFKPVVRTALKPLVAYARTKIR